jgi:membrane protein YqaA with SNARE-associated domain
LEYFGRSGAEFAVFLDADGQHDPAEIPAFVETARRAGAGIVVGTRMSDVAGMPRIRLWTNQFTSWVTGKLALQRVPDSQCGYRLVARSVVGDLRLETARFETETEMLIQAGRAGHRIASVPVPTIYVAGRQSRISPLRDTLRFFRLVKKYWPRTRGCSISGAPVKTASHTASEQPHGHEAARHLFRRMYDWTLHWAHTPYGVPALFVLAFAESSFFPIPPDVLLIALALSRREKAFWFAAVCSVGSVLGGMAGYWIGSAAWHVLQPVFIPYVFSQAAFDKVVGWYNAGAFLYVFVAAFTPIPYKVFTIAAGVCGIPFWILVLGSVVGRSARFFLVGGLLYLFGERVRKFVETYFDWLLWGLLVAVILGFVAVKFL